MAERIELFYISRHNLLKKIQNKNCLLTFKTITSIFKFYKISFVLTLISSKLQIVWIIQRDPGPFSIFVYNGCAHARLSFVVVVYSLTNCRGILLPHIHSVVTSTEFVSVIGRSFPPLCGARAYRQTDTCCRSTTLGLRCPFVFDWVPILGFVRSHVADGNC